MNHKGHVAVIPKGTTFVVVVWPGGGFMTLTVPATAGRWEQDQSYKDQPYNQDDVTTALLEALRGRDR